MLRRFVFIAAVAASAGSSARAADDAPWRKPGPFEPTSRQAERAAPETAVPWTGAYMGVNGGVITNADRPTAAPPAETIR